MEREFQKRTGLIKEINPLDVVFTLKRYGFGHDEILHELTYLQVRHYFEMAQKEDERAFASMTLSVAGGMSGDEEHMKKLSKVL